VFWRKKTYDRTTVLEAADAARGRGRVRKAVAGYAQILANDPEDHLVHARVAPLFARLRKWNEARKSFDAAGAGYQTAGFSDKAIAVWALAAQHFPEDVDYWERIANEQMKKGRRADAVRALLEGRGQLRKRKQRPLAILLLRQVLEVDAFHVDATIDLARLLKAEGSLHEGLRLLRQLRPWAKGRDVRRVRLAMVLLSPSWRGALDWLFRR
jgi:tetratricopeptide (TPR) repeat protein